MNGGTWVVENGKEVAYVRGADGKLTKVSAITTTRTAPKPPRVAGEK